MTVKLAVLKSGENVISNIKEMVVEDRVIGYVFDKPYIVFLKNIEGIYENNSENSHKFDVNIFPWIPVTSDKEIPIPSDWIVTLVEPMNNLKKIYKEKVLKDDKNFDSNEQSDSGVSD